MKWYMKEFISPRKSENDSIYGTVKAIKRKKILILHKNLPMAKVPILYKINQKVLQML